MFWRRPRFRSRSEYRTFQLYARLATLWCKLCKKPSGFRKRSSWYSFRAMLGSTVDRYTFCVSSGMLLDVFSTCWWYSAPEVDSVPAFLCVAALVVDLGVVCACWFLVTVHVALCSLRLLQAWERRSRTVDASVAIFAGIWKLCS